MKWSDLTLKERKQIYDAVRAENPNASYFDIKSQFDLIPEYEDGKNRSRWLSDKAYRDSISTLQNSQRFKISKEFKSPTLEELRDDSSVGGNIGNSDGLFTVLDGLEALKTTPSITSEQIENATDSQYNSRINRLEPLKQYAKVGSIIGQAALGGGAIVAGNAGNAALSSVLQGAGALWDEVEAIQAVNDGDFKSVIQNVVPIGAAGVALLKYTPKFKYTNNLVIDAAENIGPIWDFSVNPIIESTKDGKAPAYEDGGKKIVPPRELGLTPGTPEYYKRQQQISGKANSIQPEVYVTSAGYIKDAIDFGEDVYQGNYGQAMIDVALNALPWGSSKIAKRAKRYLSRMGNSEVTVLNSKSSKSKVKTEADYDSEFSEVIRRERNIKKYNDEISRSIETAVYPDEETLKWLQFTDNMYGTNYQKAYKELAARDMTNRSKYIKYSELPDGIQGKTIGKNIDPNIGPTIGNYQIQLDPQQYVPGTGSHELSHVVDQLAGDVIKNRYLNFLADSDNIMSVPELEKKGIRIPPKIQFYLSDPQEAKAHMIQLKHAMLNSGKINNWSQKVTQQELEDFLFDPLNTQLTGSMNKLQYKMYRNKSRFLDRFNRVNPLAIGAPIGLAATNNKDKQSN
jgi:hypothetical protein